MKTNWIRVYKSESRPIYVYAKPEGGYKVHAYQFYPRYFYGEQCLKDCIQYVKDFGESINLKEPHATV